MPDGEMIPKRCADMQERMGKLEQKAETALDAIPRIHDRVDKLWKQVAWVTGALAVAAVIAVRVLDKVW